MLAAIDNYEGTIIMVTHNGENKPYFDRTLVLRDGDIAEDSLLAQPVLAKAG